MPANDGKTLRYGYTTGACAAAAAGAAANALKEQKEMRGIEIILPEEKRVRFKVDSCSFDSEQAECSVIKDAGDDPDSTNGAEIKASVTRQKEQGITIMGGEGVGIVTKPGLEIPVGEPAINPVPREMIKKAVEQAFPNQGLKVTISVPEGEELAKKTLNSRIGIIGGISIIGTTGIVVPYSIDAYQASISQAVSIAVACGCKTIVLTTGRRSEKYAQEVFAFSEESYIQSGDFIGYSLSECAKHPVERVIIWGMTGKISKLAHGDMYTNISDSKIEFEFLMDIAKECGIPENLISKLEESVTANQFRRLLPEEFSGKFCEALCNLASCKCREHAGGRFPVRCILSDYEGNILGRSGNE
ncbi:MAG: cobalt-precorrin-5B (C(1))-methyltransferase [Dehalococcoidales bacterium]|nr:cobalt-precorrin-5B (C(1))-methyltransferase [Dehalococcoidales bacterium]